MGDTRNTIKDIKQAFENCNKKIDDHIHELKIISSEEILNGSIEEAQKILNHILPVETAAKKMLHYQEEFIKIIESANIGKNKAVKSEANNGKDNLEASEKVPARNSENNNSTENFISPNEYRVSILKSLIYLGGSASTKEVMGFIEKDLRKKFKQGDLEAVNNNGEKIWESMIKKERSVMESEGLLSEHSSDETWEIVQKGIDYLSNHGK